MALGENSGWVGCETRGRKKEVQEIRERDSNRKEKKGKGRKKEMEQYTRVSMEKPH